MSAQMRVCMREAFGNAQFNKTCHQKYTKKLKKYYEKEDKEGFGECFVSCLLIPLSKAERHPHVENVLEFAAKFAVGLYSFSGNETEEQMCPFLTKLFDFLLSHHDAKDTGARFRVCYFMNMLLNSMGEDAFIDDELCDKISAKMMERMLDKSPKVRAQAVFALHRLQDPTDEQCPVIKLFIFHLCKDPKAEVRRAVLANIGKNKSTLQAALRRTRDVADSVRKLAYQFISKITVRSLTIDQREQLLRDGLKDRSEIVSKCVRTVLLPSWLRHFNGDFISLLRGLDAENAMDTAVLALNTLFKVEELKNILEQVPLDSETKLIPHEKISSENVLYWRCTVEHLYSEGMGDETDRVLPELSKFCLYIRDFIALMGSKEFQNWEKLMHKFVLLQLFEIAKTYDLSDEIGRENLKQLILDTLLTEHCSEKIVDCIVKHMEIVIQDVDNRMFCLAEVISELRMPMVQVTTQLSEQEKHENDMKRARLKVDLLEVTEEQYEAIQNMDYLKAESLKEKINSLNREILVLCDTNDCVVNEVREENFRTDKATMVKCLGIMCAMMQVQSVRTLTPTLRSLVENMALPSLDHPEDCVHILALKAIAVGCLLDKELAKEHIMMFFLQFSVENGNQEIWLIALKAIFDLLLVYGFEHFEIEQNDEADAVNKSKKNRTVRLFSQREDRDLMESTQPNIEEGNGNIIKILTGLLDNMNQDLRTIATEGLCKLLLHKRISSAALLSRLIILWHSPVTEVDVYMRQCLSGFFRCFVVSAPESQEMLEEAFMPTLKTLANAPDISPLAQIEPDRVAQLILSLTKPGIQQPNAQTYCPHNNLAFAILAEALNIDSEIEHEVLIKCLKYLEINLEDNTMRKNLQNAVEELTQTLGNMDKRLIKLVADFKERLNVPDETQVLENATIEGEPVVTVNHADAETNNETGDVAPHQEGDDHRQPEEDVTAEDQERRNANTPDRRPRIATDIATDKDDDIHISDSGDEAMNNDEIPFVEATPHRMQNPQKNLHKNKPIQNNAMDADNGHSEDDLFADSSSGTLALESQEDNSDVSEDREQQKAVGKKNKPAKSLQAENVEAMKLKQPIVLLERVDADKNKQKKRKIKKKTTETVQKKVSMDAVMPDSDNSGHLELTDNTIRTRRSSLRGLPDVNSGRSSSIMSDNSIRTLRNSSIQSPVIATRRSSRNKSKSTSAKSVDSQDSEHSEVEVRRNKKARGKTATSRSEDSCSQESDAESRRYNARIAGNSLKVPQLKNVKKTGKQKGKNATSIVLQPVIIPDSDPSSDDEMDDVQPMGRRSSTRSSTHKHH